MNEALDRVPEPTTQSTETDTSVAQATPAPGPDLRALVRDLPPAVEVDGPILSDPDARPRSSDPLDPHAPSRETGDPLDPDGRVS